MLCDGAYYDVRRLAAQIMPSWQPQPTGFFQQVVAARAARLDELYARLQAGQRPTEARLHDVRALAPCDTSRSLYVQLEQAVDGGAGVGGPPPRFYHCDARALVGHGQPVLFPVGHTGNPELRVGLAVVLAEELWRAGPREAERAVLGFSLLLDWRDDCNRQVVGPGQVPSQLGPALVLGPSMATLERRSIRVTTAEGVHEVKAIGEGDLDLGEGLAFISQHLHLCPGDLVGLPARLRVVLSFGEAVTASLTEMLTLQGWALSGSEAADWRR